MIMFIWMFMIATTMMLLMVRFTKSEVSGLAHSSSSVHACLQESTLQNSASHNYSKSAFSYFFSKSILMYDQSFTLEGNPLAFSSRPDLLSLQSSDSQPPDQDRNQLPDEDYFHLVMWIGMGIHGKLCM